ncbi:hypothetical protein A2U01_0050968, partial [Trifolium medium]|nr:hypothetical protein [Trifolium medium]
DTFEDPLMLGKGCFWGFFEVSLSRACGMLSRIHVEEECFIGSSNFRRGFRVTLSLRIFRGDFLGFGEICEQADVT